MPAEESDHHDERREQTRNHLINNVTASCARVCRTNTHTRRCGGSSLATWVVPATMNRNFSFRISVRTVSAVVVCALAIPSISAAQSGTMSTVAGSYLVRGYSGDGGAATSARLNEPYGVGVDGAGNIYIADTVNQVIRKVVRSTGVITTVAGSGVKGFSGDGGPATSASLSDPLAVAADGSGNLYISDQLNNRIRKVTPAGTITTFAGTGAAGYNGDGIAATQAQLHSPYMAAVDAAGNLYIPDYFNYRIRKVTASTGLISTVAGIGVSGGDGDGGPATRAYISDPTGVTIDGAGNLFLVDQATFRIRMVERIATAPGGPPPPPPPPTPTPVAPRTDMDGDGLGDLTVWRPGNGTWFTLTSSSAYSYSAQSQRQWGNQAAGHVPLMGDIDGDRSADLVVWRASTGTWYWLTSSTGYSPSFAGQKQWGNKGLGDVPMLADIDADGRMDLVLWRASTGTWFWLTSSTGYNYNASGSKQFGSQANNDVPKIGDMDGDGRAELIVWRPATGMWFWLTSSSGYTQQGQKQWGNQNAGDVPMIGDIDGDAKVELVVWRASTGTWYWLTSRSAYSGTAGIQWGSQSAGDVPLLADLDADGQAELIVWRASTGTWHWLRSLGGYSYNSPGTRQWGGQGDIPIVK